MRLSGWPRAIGVFWRPSFSAPSSQTRCGKKQLHGEIEGFSAARILDSFGRVAIEMFALAPLLPAAFAIASAARHSVYDCLYLALAERQDCPLVTGDRRFYHAFAGSHLGHRMLWLEDFNS
jgi:predicted nucleic acid-binding protein